MREPGLSELIARYKELGSRICAEIGHDWEPVDPGLYTNVSKLERCTRCSEERLVPPFGQDTPRRLEK